MTPWPEDLQPLDRPLYDAGVIDLAWRAVWAKLVAPDDEVREALVRLLASMAGRPQEQVSRPLRKWMARGDPLDGLRAVYPKRTPPRLRDAEVHLFLQGALLKDEPGSLLAWQMLVRAGMRPDEAKEALERWTLSDGVLPTGQWFAQEDLEAAVPPEQKDQALYRFSNGAVMPWVELLDLANQASNGRRIQSIKEVRRRTDCGLKEAYHLIRDMCSGLVVPNSSSRALQLSTDRDSDRTPARRRLDACIDGLLRDRPMHWVILAMADIREDATHPTMAVGLTELGQLVLFYNPSFVRKISRQQCKGVLLHEINHVLFGHLSPPAELESVRAWRMACECTANEFIPYPLPGSPITLEVMDLPPMESTLARYSRLKERPSLPGTPCQGILLLRLAEDPSAHNHIADGQAITPTHILLEAAELVGDEIDRQTLDALRGEGSGLSAQLLMHLEPEGLGSLQWDVLLRKKAQALHRRRATRRFPSRRFPDQIGIIPGRRRHREHPTVLAAVDTSGSMTTEELSAITAELRGLTRQNLKVGLIQCDAQIHEARWLDPGFTKMAVKGRGGTDLRPPFSPPQLERFRPGLIVYFTDGYGPAPDSPPPGVEVLWVLTGERPRVPARYGQVVCMRDRSARQRITPPT